MTSPTIHPRDPLHGVKLETIVNHLVTKHGWTEMGNRIPIRCFQMNPSVKSSLTFLRKTPWARQKVEDWYVRESRNNPAPCGKAAFGCASLKAFDNGFRKTE